MLNLHHITNNQLNYINIGLMLISLVLAFILPFELFLFSYAILGPLHYLTEIGWLHKKNYFTKGKYDFLFLSLLCVLVFYFSFIKPAKASTIIPSLIAYALLLSLIFVFVKDNMYRVALCLLALIGLYTNKAGENFFMWFAVFLPTIIHVLLFTWIFMFFGVLKNKSFSGFLSVIVLVLCVASMFIIKAPALQYQISSYVYKSYEVFSLLNKYIIQFLGLKSANENMSTAVFQSNVGFMIMRFIAFSYTYHYLNWFSKTSIIQWHKVPKKTLLFTLAAWLISIVIYAYDYTVGLRALYFLSFLHVFLEFPLNITSFKGVFVNIFSKQRI